MTLVKRKQIEEWPVRTVENAGEDGSWSGSTGLGEAVRLLYPAKEVALTVTATDGEGLLIYTGGDPMEGDLVRLTVTASGGRSVYYAERTGVGHDDAGLTDQYARPDEGETAFVRITAVGGMVVVSPI